jgi:outer membrane protein assembly factor BamC
MKRINYLTVIVVSLLTISCSKVIDPVKKIGLGNRVVNYQSDTQVDSLVIPPDLTEPSLEGKFTQIIEINNDNDVVREVLNVEVKRDKYRRWLVVDKSPQDVWGLAKEFFRSYGFKIEKENQKIGLLETDYLEIDTKVPDKSLGMIRSMLAKSLKTQYGLPIADKYRIRIESSDEPNTTEVYLTLTSIGEVVKGDQTLWQPRSKDVELETEMLLTLMVFLGSERTEAISKIQSNNVINEIIVSVEATESVYTSLLFPHDKKTTWNY